MVIQKRLVGVGIGIKIGFRNLKFLEKQLAVFKMPAEISRGEIYGLGEQEEIKNQQKEQDDYFRFLWSFPHKVISLSYYGFFVWHRPRNSY